jgi:chromosome segregation ATPase
MKSLEERMRHEEAKKNEYINEGKKLSIRVKELEKANHEKKLSLELQQKELAKYTEYAHQAEERITDLEEQLDLMLQLKKELAALADKNRTSEEEINKLSSSLSHKIQELSALRERVGQY